MTGCSAKCQKQKKVSKQKGKWYFPVLTSLLVALIPKCPFCILAYSSAITLCSGATYYNHSPSWTSYISIGLAAMTFLMVALNFRGQRTYWALLLVLIGSALIIRTELYTGELVDYYWGAGILIFGVWFNASFLYFFRLIYRNLIPNKQTIESPIKSNT